MSFTPVEIILYGLLGLGILLLTMMILWHFVRLGRTSVRQWQASRQRKPDVLLALRMDNSRLRAEHAMMARKLEVVMDDARTRIARHEAEASRAINRAGLLAEQLEETRETLSLREQAIKQLNAQIAELEGKLRETTERAEKLFAERSELNLALEEKTEQLHSLADTLARREDALARARTVASTLREEAHAGKHQVKRLEQERNSLLEQLTRMEKQLEKSRETARQLEQELAEVRNTHLREKMDLQERINELSATLARREAEQLAASSASAADRKEKTRASA